MTRNTPKLLVEILGQKGQDRVLRVRDVISGKVTIRLHVIGEDVPWSVGIIGRGVSFRPDPLHGPPKELSHRDGRNPAKLM